MYCLAVLSLAHSPQAIFWEKFLVFFPVRQLWHLPFTPVMEEQTAKLSTIKMAASFAYLLYSVLLIKDSDHASDKSQDQNHINSEQSEIKKPNKNCVNLTNILIILFYACLCKRHRPTGSKKIAYLGFPPYTVAAWFFSSHQPEFREEEDFSLNTEFS